MEQPYPIQFVQDGADIVLRMEEYDTVRTIHLGDTEPGEARAKSLLGYSQGHWVWRPGEEIKPYDCTWGD